MSNTVIYFCFKGYANTVMYFCIKCNTEFICEIEAELSKCILLCYYSVTNLLMPASELQSNR